MAECIRLNIVGNIFDYVAGLYRDQLNNAGYSFDASDDPDDIVLSYLRVLHRHIPTKPRTVYVAKEFVCPPDNRSAFDAICHKAETGHDLRPHQHRDLGYANFDDGLLNDWGIHHLHLSTLMCPDGFVERSGPVLFARITHDAFYCLKIMPHGRGHHNWSRQELLEIIHQNWPASIENSQLIGPPSLPVTGFERSFTDEEITTLRKKGVNVVTQRADGTVHLPIGRGVMSSRVSATVVVERDRLRYLCAALDTRIALTLKGLVEAAISSGKCAPSDKFSFHLKIVSGDVVAIEDISNIEYNLGPIAVNIPAIR